MQSNDGMQVDDGLAAGDRLAQYQYAVPAGTAMVV
jgi:hypothetical protein